MGMEMPNSDILKFTAQAIFCEVISVRLLPGSGSVVLKELGVAGLRCIGKLGADRLASQRHA